MPRGIERATMADRAGANLIATSRAGRLCKAFHSVLLTCSFFQEQLRDCAFVRERRCVLAHVSGRFCNALLIRA